MTTTEKDAEQIAAAPSEAAETNHQEDPQVRVQRCEQSVRALLAAHRCKIVPTLEPEQVGMGPLTRVMISGAWSIFPEEMR